MASTHFVAWFVATNMFPIYLLTNFIGPTKSSPHFITCFFGRIATNLTKFYVANPQVCWHTSHDLQNSLTSLNIVVPSTPHPIFFLCDFCCKVFSCCFLMQLLHHPLCFFVVDKHCFNLLSYPILYITPPFEFKIIS